MHTDTHTYTRRHSNKDTEANTIKTITKLFEAVSELIYQSVEL